MSSRAPFAASGGLASVVYRADAPVDMALSLAGPIYITFARLSQDKWGWRAISVRRFIENSFGIYRHVLHLKYGWNAS
jgi:hypothetical protein